MNENNTPRRHYPADAFGIRVELVDGPIYCDDGRTAGAAVEAEGLIHVDRRLSIQDRRTCAAEARRHILEMNLPAEEMAALAADLAEAERKLYGVPPRMPAGGYRLDPDPQTGRWHCPLCRSKKYKTQGGIWDHLRKVHDLDCLSGRWMPAPLFKRELARLTDRMTGRTQRGDGRAA